MSLSFQAWSTKNTFKIGKIDSGVYIGFCFGLWKEISY